MRNSFDISLNMHLRHAHRHANVPLLALQRAVWVVYECALLLCGQMTQSVNSESMPVWISVYVCKFKSLQWYVCGRLPALIFVHTLKSLYWALVSCCFCSQQANLLYNGCRADWSSFIDVWVVDEWAGREEEVGFITSFNKSQGLWQSRGGLGGKSLGAQFYTTVFSPLRFSVWFCPFFSGIIQAECLVWHCNQPASAAIKCSLIFCSRHICVSSVM